MRRLRQKAHTIKITKCSDIVQLELDSWHCMLTALCRRRRTVNNNIYICMRMYIDTLCNTIKTKIDSLLRYIYIYIFEDTSKDTITGRQQSAFSLHLIFSRLSERLPACRNMCYCCCCCCQSSMPLRLH